MGSIDGAANQLAARQHGVVTRVQLRHLGLTDRQITARLSAGLLAPVHRGVLRVTAVPRSHEQALMAACLAGGSHAVASHRSAAALWELRGVEHPPLEITVVAARPRLDRVLVHRSL